MKLYFPSPVVDLAWKPDGSQLAVALSNFTFQTISLANQQVQHIFVGHSEGITELSWHPDGNILLSSSADGTIKRWGANTAELLATYDTGISVMSVNWHPTANRFISGDLRGNILTWEPDQPTPIHSKFTAQFITWVDWSPDGSKLAVMGYDGFGAVYEAASFSLLFHLNGPTDDLLAAAWNSDGSKIAAGEWGEVDKPGLIYIWGMDKSQPAVILRDHTNGVMALSWHPSDEYLASGSLEKAVRIWDTATWENIQVIQTTGLTDATAWSPDGRYLAYGGDEACAVTVVAFP